MRFSTLPDFDGATGAVAAALHTRATTMHPLHLSFSSLLFASLLSLGTVGCLGGTQTDLFDGQRTSEAEIDSSGTQPPPACPPVATPMCAQGTTLVSRTDATGCAFYTCERACPEIDVPTCAPGEELVTGTDEGCAFAYCKPIACPPVAMPMCDAGSELVSYVDETGCPAAYCKPAACPPVAMPLCANGTKLVSKQDASGCTFYECK